MLKFKDNPYGGTNQLIDEECEDFYLSYNPRPEREIPFFTADGGGEETALCITKEEDKQWCILNGDYRKEYEKVAHLGIKAVVQKYLNLRENGAEVSTWSSGSDPIKWLKQRFGE